MTISKLKLKFRSKPEMVQALTDDELKIIWSGAEKLFLWQLKLFL